MYEEDLPLGMIVGNMMMEIFKVLKHRIESSMNEKLSVHHLGLLLAICKNDEEVIQQDMATKLGKDKSAILRLIDALEEKQMVSRIPDLGDRRKNKLVLTEQGNEAVKEFLVIEKELLKELKSGISDEDMKIFFNVVKKIKENAQKL